MLKKILKAESCAECRVCCVFDKTDVWEIPVVSKELAQKIKGAYGDIQLEKFSSDYRFRMDFDKETGLAECPMLTETGCALKDSKPFDCRVWPFRVMRLSDNLIGLTVSPVCDAVSSLPLSKLCGFICDEKLDEIIFEYAKSNPEAIKPYIDGYPVLKIAELK